ncbi:protein ILRUN [Biomphalaria pfeifferi]|uniref:Protein ILRUN n=1 Tax=Biomphalaria pfeifferi TaxID=112525 RepID=A0AAD8BU76_BIOPF|nr:protein ILRUN [Biomphalaria pfeifferi]
MDVDIDDFDGKLLDQFRSLGTTDRDVLIAQFQSLLGNKLNRESCAFFLDMNNWNLQNAVCSYYDFEQPSNSLPRMSFVADVTVGDGEAVAPNTIFFKTWRIKNSGIDRWPPGCHLRFCNGDNLSMIERRMVDALGPGQTVDIDVEMKSPSRVGMYQSQWKMCTATGMYFGDVIHVETNVTEGGLLGITQQLARIGQQNHSNSNNIMFQSSDASQNVLSLDSRHHQIIPFTGISFNTNSGSSADLSSSSTNEDDLDMS